MPSRPKHSSPAVKAGVYTRISSDPSGHQAGVERQRADCEAHCVARGWEFVEVFCDNDASAYGRKPRQAYERMRTSVIRPGSRPPSVRRPWPHDDRSLLEHPRRAGAAGDLGLRPHCVGAVVLSNSRAVRTRRRPKR